MYLSYLLNDPTASSHLSANTPELIKLMTQDSKVSGLELTWAFYTSPEDFFMIRLLEQQPLRHSVANLMYLYVSCIVLLHLFFWVKRSSLKSLLWQASPPRVLHKHSFSSQSVKLCTTRYKLILKIYSPLFFFFYHWLMFNMNCIYLL